ncbi:MAG: hypothetical protein EPO62_07180 [Candidatus Nitrosotenuis sp.]|nr:MAG: hypothetical protein EPO62_07180 [Candidatus Nitrosotenuis sp.]
MTDSEHDFKIEQVAELIAQDRVSLDEQDQKKLQKYRDFVKTKFHIEGDPATELVNEAFLYLKLVNAKDVDPLQDGDKFGAGFS